MGFTLRLAFKKENLSDAKILVWTSIEIILKRFCPDSFSFFNPQPTEALPSIADVCEEYFRQSCDCGDSAAAALFNKRAPGWGKRAGNEADETPAEIFGRLAQMKRAPGWGKRGEK